ncbi:glycosyltransferase [Amycolatopsis sp. cmx-11-12]|uniref:glycosyltransferase n=1 Tax=Amycolatopsis sp. cmx-11-12 TaxID=2785795 RepID=UPI0039183888
MVADQQAIAGGLVADPRMSPHGVRAFTTRELLGPVALPKRVRLVGPSIGGRTPTGDFPWDRLDPALPMVFVTLGTANADAAVGTVGDTVLVVPRVPQMALLARVDAVVCHGGAATAADHLESLLG